MALVEQDLRGDVLRSATNGVSPLSDHLRKAKVDELEEAVIPYHDVLWLEVSVTDIFIVQVLEDGDDLGSVKAKEGVKGREGEDTLSASR
jgi:hypothetical protein